MRLLILALLSAISLAQTGRLHPQFEQMVGKAHGRRLKMEPSHPKRFSVQKTTGCPDGEVAPSVGLNFGEATLERANLGGLQSGQPNGILYKNVGNIEGEPVGLRVTISPEETNPVYECSNGQCFDNLSGQFGQIQINYQNNPRSLRLRFEIVDDNEDVVPFDIMYMTYLDVDGAEFEQEKITFHDVFEYYVHDETYLEITDNIATSGEVIASNPLGLGQIPNPTQINGLTEEQEKVSIMGEWVGVPGIGLNYFDVSIGTMKRTILFAGASSSAITICKTCATGFFGTCEFGELPNQDSIKCYDGETDLCNEDTCCATATPLATEEVERATSHGDPIIWTFHGECYDLNMDGMYLASSHPRYDHDVYVSVYNDFMREIQVVDKDGKILLALNTMGEVLNNGYPYTFKETVKDCPEKEETKNECVGSYTEWQFDAQHFRYSVQIMRHDYLDAALAEGELGYHLDIYPEPYGRFKANKHDYTGLYFDNPLPEELQYCEGGSLGPRQSKRM